MTVKTDSIRYSFLAKTISKIQVLRMIHVINKLKLCEEAIAMMTYSRTITEVKHIFKAVTDANKLHRFIVSFGVVGPEEHHF